MNRKNQYKRKSEFIIDKITHLPENIDENKFFIDALFYRLQISIDASMDIVAMLCKDLGITVQDDYSNLDELEKISLFTPGLINNLRKWNGLRNVLVYKYNKIEEDIIFQNKVSVVETLIAFIKEVEVIINEKIKFND
ncbi:hypothetical protein LCGC14_0791740 [marine sediment metagenome]|uniref:DUF86 domain-containing protein n=1 Tax=marine sediment metagenome TaxID=412755 RepID=A0A0F9QC34_9ZZZZ